MSEGVKRELSPASKVTKAPCCTLEGVPEEASLAEVESVLQPLCGGRIVSIGLQPAGQGLVEFEREQDADACVGSQQLLGQTIKVERPDSSDTPTKRQRKRSPTKSGSGVGTSSPLSQERVTTEMAPAVTTETPAQTAAAAKKAQRAEAKREKERRLNRVGLSYRCGRCGQPKKGHVCTLTDSEIAEAQAAGGGDEGQKPKGGAWDLDSEALFKDIKSVLTKPMTPGGAPSGAASASTDAAAEASSSKKASGCESSPAPPALAHAQSPSLSRRAVALSRESSPPPPHTRLPASQ